MATTTNLSRLMRISWDIQKRKRKTRSKSLTAGWAILNNEDITVHYLALRLNRNKEVRPQALNQISIFKS